MIPYRKVRIIIRENYCLILPLCIIMLLCSTHVYYNFKDTGVQRSQVQDMQLSIDRSKQQVVVSPQGSHSQVLTEKQLHETSKRPEPKHSKVSDKVTDIEAAKVSDKVPDKVSDKVTDRQNERRKLIEETCAKHSSVMNRQASSSWKLKLNTRDRYLLCPIPKSGWSSWKRLWHFTAGLISSYATDVGNGADTAAGVKDVTANRLSTEWRKKSYTYSFVFFRNPWDRLVSAYINKAVEYNYSRILHTPCRWESMKPYKKEPLTFKQFLTCIADGSNDMHWTPQWKLCNVCGTKYDFIGHLDTVEEDAKKVIADIGLNVTYPHSFASKMKKTNAEWYKNVPADLLKRLQSRYQFDFELHGWSPQPPGRSDVG